MPKNDDIVGLEGDNKIVAIALNRYFSPRSSWKRVADYVADHGHAPTPTFSAMDDWQPIAG